MADRVNLTVPTLYQGVEYPGISIGEGVNVGFNYAVCSPPEMNLWQLIFEGTDFQGNVIVRNADKAPIVFNSNATSATFEEVVPAHYLTIDVMAAS